MPGESGTATGTIARRLPGDRVEEALQQRADLQGELARGHAEQPSRRSLVRTLVWLAITGVSLYLVEPTLLDTLASWRQLTKLSPAWIPVMVALRAVSVVSLWWLHRLALHKPRWHVVATSQLAGNAMAKVAPGGGAVGAALQYRMLL